MTQVMTDQTQTPTTTEEPLGSQDRLDALYRGAWQQWTREHNAKMEIKRLTKEIALLRPELGAAHSDQPQSDLVERVARAIREEIIRQHRDNERGKCPAGAAFYEEHIAPSQIALIAVKEILAWPESTVGEATTECDPLKAAGERNSAFWRGHNILADFIQVTTNMISPRLACRFADYHTWVGDPIHDTCRFCGLKI
jgi:hypothetical protein